MSVTPPPDNPFAAPTPGNAAPPPGYAAPPPGYAASPPGHAAPPPGYAAPPPGYGYVRPPAWPSPPRPPLAEWGQRVLGYLVDAALSGWPMLIALVVLLTTLEPHRETFDGSAALVWFWPSPTGIAAYLVASFVSFGISLWNVVLLQGRTGQSVGKRVVGIRLVSEATLQPVGPLMSFVRQLAHYADGLALDIGYLWPLWDEKRRTFADMIMKTVVIVAT